MSAFPIPQDFSNDQGDLSSDDSLGEFWHNFLYIYSQII